MVLGPKPWKFKTTFFPVIRYVVSAITCDALFSASLRAFFRRRTSSSSFLISYSSFFRLSIICNKQDCHIGNFVMEYFLNYNPIIAQQSGNEE